jgi:hypothetical protein
MTKIMETNNYSRFVVQPFNRDVKKTWHLEESFKQDGFRDDEPLSVTRLPDSRGPAFDRFLVNEGHHRFYVARKLKIPVKYVEMKIPPMSPSRKLKTTKTWSLKNCMEGWVRIGKPAYICVLRYYEKTGIGLAACISMLAGDSAGSGHWNDQFKDGTYMLGDPSHADIVGDIVIHCRELGIPYYKHRPFVNAISKIAWAEGFDPKVLKNKLTLYPEFVKKQSGKDEYVKQFEDIYNRRSQTLLPLQIKAEEAARKRERGGRAYTIRGSTRPKTDLPKSPPTPLP